ncbi:MAG: colicin immunity domain-containing protein [Neisseria sp.]|nr:colicin immunity domain-containing protein [Neisseria sp.]
MSRTLRQKVDEFVAGSISADQFADEYINLYDQLKGVAHEGFKSARIPSSLFIQADLYCPTAQRHIRKDYEYDEHRLLQAVKLFLVASEPGEAYDELERLGIIR